MQTPHESRMCPIDFEVKRSRSQCINYWKIVPAGVLNPDLVSGWSMLPCNDRWCRYRTKWKEKKEEIWLIPMTKAPFIHRTIQKATWQHKNATKNFYYTALADRLKTVSGSNNSHLTGVVKPVYERSDWNILHKGPKYRKHVSFSWNMNFNIIMDACKIYMPDGDQERECRTEVPLFLSKTQNPLSTPDKSLLSVTLMSEISGLHENFSKCLQIMRVRTIIMKYYADILIERTSWEFLRNAYK